MIGVNHNLSCLSAKADRGTRFALGGEPYIIRIFLGDVPEGPPFYFAETPTEAGFVYNFSGTVTSRGTGEGGCGNCRAQQEEGALGSGQVILTDYLVENITKERTLRGLALSSLSPQEVIEYLRTYLHWRISDVGFCSLHIQTGTDMEYETSVTIILHQKSPCHP